MFSPVSPKPNWSELQQSMLDYWKEKKLFERSVSERPADNPYRFYDGPPFITGMPHYGSLLSSIIKDVVPRYQTMKGKRVERVWGWDCHGLPIEQKVQAKLGLGSNAAIEENGIEKFIEECYNYTNNTSAEWNWYIDHIGRWVDMDNAYKTMDQDYMESVLHVFKRLYDKGLVYEGKRVSWYSWKLSTPISNFEIAMDDSYIESQDTAVTVKFKIQNGEGDMRDASLLAWTTTPWTVPMHMAIAVHEDLDYVVVESEGEKYIVAKNRTETVFKGKEHAIIGQMKGSDLVGLKYTPPFDFYVGKIDPDKNHIVYHADFVTDESGTGIAHEAPEFGDVDFALAQEKGIHITEAIDDAGLYTSEVPDYEGQLFLDVIEPVTQRLKDEGKLFKKESITHRVPECPRSKTLLMQKAQKSWFIDIKTLKPKLFEKNEDINWFPEHVKHGRFKKSLETAPDWCISRSRYWGTPMPIWQNSDGSERKVIGSLDELYEANKPLGQMTKIIFVRHGETVENEKGVLNFQDSELSVRGKKQVLEVAESLKNENIDVIISSSTKRTIDTSEAIRSISGADIIFDDRIQEWCKGEMGGTIKDDSWQVEINRSLSDHSYKHGGYESIDDMYMRGKSFLQDLFAQHLGKTIVLVSHKGSGRVLFSLLSGSEFDRNLNINNASSTSFFIQNSTRKEVNLHRPYIDDIYVPSPDSKKPKKVLGIHGWTSRGLQKPNSTWGKLQEVLAHESIEFDVPSFDPSESTSYAKWADTLNTLDMDAYDTIIATSYGARVIMEYLVQKQIHIDRLILVAPSGLQGNAYLEKIIPEMKSDISDLRSYAKEIIVTHSRDDASTSAPFTVGQKFAQETGATFVPVDGVGHQFGGWGVDFLRTLIVDGAPLKRIPEVFDCWVESGSMPWAQDHYPFENKDKMEASFPADFIAEYTGQIRAWFYVMHVLAVALEDDPSFKNVVVTGVINGTDGRKMSKSYGNYPDPKATIEQYGADALRFYLMNSPVMRGEDLNFSEEGIQEVLKKVVLPLWNAYSFFSTYANIDGWSDQQGEISFIRHGQTSNNAEGRLNGGDNDIGLNEVGEEQARDINKLLKTQGSSFDVVYCSSKLRTKQTAEIALDGISYGEIVYTDDLIEQYFGEYDSRLHSELMEELGLSDTNELRMLYRNNGKESLDAFRARVQNCIDTIKQNHPGKRVLIVAHGGVFRVLKEMSFQLDEERVWLWKSFPYGTIAPIPWSPKTNELDTWIISQLHGLVSEVTQNLEAYDIQKACEPFVRFLDNLNNWYIRRNRRRFWKGEMDTDKQAGYETLHEVLVTVCELLAPICPFVTDVLYQRLTGKESVHLVRYPESRPNFIFEKVNARVTSVQNIVSLGLAFRSKNSLRVRQPLSSVWVVDDLDADQIQVICEELNVKEVKKIENIDAYATITYAPDARKIGQSDRKRYMKDILTKAKSGDVQMDGDMLVIDVDDQKIVLESDEFEVRYIPKEGTDIQFEAGFGTVVGVDATLTEVLIQEGYARDIVRAIQDARKEAGFEITDRIVFGLEGDAALVTSAEAFISLIEQEVLGSYNQDMSIGDKSVMVELDGKKVEVFLLKA